MQHHGTTADLPAPRPAPASEGRRWVGEEQEAARIETLRGFGILDTDPEQVFDDLTELAGQLCGAPMALVSLVDTDRQWFKSTVGISLAETPREVSFCSHALDTKSVFVVRDAAADERFADNSLVTGSPYIRSYAGAPLVTAAGHTLGTLCVLDTAPREFSEVQLHALQVLARQVVSQLELRRQTEALRSEVAARTEAQAKLLASEEALRAARDELAERQVFIEAVLDSIDTGIVACDADGRVTVVNRTVQSWAPGAVDNGGVPERPQLYDLAGVPLASDRLPLTRSLAEGGFAGAELLITPLGRPAVYAVATGRRVTTPDGRSLGAVVALTDVTAAREQTKALKVSEARFRTTFENAPMGLAVVATAGPALQVNPALCRIVGRTAEELLALPNLLALAAPDDQADLAGIGRRALETPGTTISREQRLLRPDGTELWAQVTVTELGGSDNARTLLLQLEDISERRATEDRLTRQAMYDPLTDLPNRALLYDRATAALSRLDRTPHGGLLVLLFLDLDGFKEINDTYGHAAGDQVLSGVAARLSLVMRPSDMVARIGGDEFLVLCENVRDRDRAHLIGDRLRKVVAVPTTWNGVVLTVTASVGIAFGSPGDTPASLVRIADAAMYEAKRSR